MSFHERIRPSSLGALHTKGRASKTCSLDTARAVRMYPKKLQGPSKESPVTCGRKHAQHDQGQPDVEDHGLEPIISQTEGFRQNQQSGINDIRLERQFKPFKTLMARGRPKNTAARTLPALASQHALLKDAEKSSFT